MNKITDLIVREIVQGKTPFDVFGRTLRNLRPIAARRVEETSE